MAQTGYTPIQLYSTPTPGASPAASNLTSGELAINAADGKLFYKDTAGNTQVIANSAFSSFSTGVAIQGSGTSVVATGTVQFANSNGVTFGLNGSTITGSVVPGPSIQGSGTDVVSAGTVQFANSNGVTFGLNGSTMTASVSPAAGNITFSAGTASTATNNLVFANSGGISFGLTSNTIAVSQVLTSCVPGTQFTGYGFQPVVLSGVFAPITLTDSLAFAKAEHILQLADNVGGDRVTYNLAASTDLANYGFSQTHTFYHNIYSKTDGTLSTQVNMTMTWSVWGAASVSVATATATQSYTYLLSQSVSVVYPIGTSSYGYSLSTVSASSTYSTVRQSTLSTATTSYTFVPTFASGLTAKMAATMVNSAPTTLAPNTYWVGIGYNSSATRGTGITTGNGFIGIGVYTHHQLQSNLLGAEAFPSPGLLMNSVAANFTDFGMVYAVTNAAFFTATYFKSLATGASVGSYASTNAIFTQVGTTTSAQVTDSTGGTSAASFPANLYFPRVTYQ